MVSALRLEVWGLIRSGERLLLIKIRVFNTFIL